MLSKDELVAMLVGLSAACDIALVDEDRSLPLEVCAEKDRETVREVAHSLDRLLHNFSYTRSPEFLRSIAGKSEAVVAMHLKIAADPVKRKGFQARFENALGTLLSKDDAYVLLPEPEHRVLDRIRDSVHRLANPEQRYQS